MILTRSLFDSNSWRIDFVNSSSLAISSAILFVNCASGEIPNRCASICSAIFDFFFLEIWGMTFYVGERFYSLT